MKQAAIASAIFFIIACSIVPSACAELVGARIFVGGKEATLTQSAVWDGKRVLAPIDILDLLEAGYIVSKDDKKMAVISADGQSADIETINAGGVRMLPMDKLLDLIGGDSTWDADAKTLSLAACLRSVEFVNETLIVNCSFPVAYTVKPWTSGNKLIVDIPSVKIESDAREVYVGAGHVQRARLGSDGANARVVLDMDKNLTYKVISDPIAAQIQIKVSDSIPKSKAKKSMESKAGNKAPFEVSGVRVDAVDDTSFNLVISTKGKGSASIAYGVAPPEIVVSMPGGSLEDTASKGVGSHPLLKSIKVIEPAKVKLELNRVMVYGLHIDDSSITVSVQQPGNSGGKLADKLIVIDPGHGGNQAGACCGDVREKDINLRIANELAAQLKAQGARTALTRTSDVAMGLAARPEVALAAGADFFISIHCNSNGTPNSASGIETYYHFYEPSPMALAYAVHAGVCTATGMCDRKPRSDKSLYESGLAVLSRLENSNTPGILLECGYMNHSSDRAKLLDANYRKKLAAGIVSGLKAYVEGK
ncbi:MAG: N-acetylmuramoyl-L-alanine amidase [Armatimonadota bacterium]|nr:N-acetylmuramoyl-L-alanine amidase [bacterium]